MTNQSQPGNNNHNSTTTRRQHNNHWTSSQPLDPLPAPPLPPPPTSKSPASRTTSTSSPSRYDNTLTRPPTSSGSTSSSVSSSNRHLTNHSHNHYPSADHDPSLLYAHQNYSSNNNITNNSNNNGGDNNTVRSMSFLKSHHHTNSPQHQGTTTNSASSHGNKHNKQNSIGKGDHYNNGSHHHHHHHSHNHSIGHNSNSSSNSNNSSRELPSVQQAVSSIPSMLQLQQLQQQQIEDGSFDHDLQQQLQQQQLHGYIHEGGDNVMMQEWLHKRSSSLQLVWKRRWCVLREDRLFFYRTNTDTKPLGMLHLSEYSILAAGPEISRKSKLAFRLSSPEPIPHQQQHHVFFTESAQSLHNWLYSLQLHINHATATWFSKAATSSATGLGLQQTGGAASGGLSRRMDQDGVVPGQSIIDKVLDRLHLDNSSTAGEPGAPIGSMSDSTITSTVKDQPRLPYIPPNFSLSHEDNNDTWSSTSSMPNTSTNTSTNLEYIFALTQQNQASKSSMDSIRGGNDSSEQQAHSQGSPIASGGASHQPIHPTPLSYATSSTGYAGSTFTDQSSVTSEAIRFSADYQGRSSLHQPRPSPGAGNGFLVGSASPQMYPIRSSIHSGLSAENGAGSPSTSVAGSPFASPTLSSQHPSVLSSNNNSSSNNNHHAHSHTGSASPRTFYRVLENNSPSKRAESIASSASISTIASSGDVSTINDLNSENGLSSTATDSSLPSKPKSAGATILGLVTGGSKHKKDKKDGSNAGSNHSGSGSGSGSSGLKLFGSGVCHYSGCTQMAKTCTFHNKKFRPESPNAIASRKAKEEKKAAKETAKEEKKTGKSSLWSSSSDKSGSQGNISEISSPIMMKADGSLLTNYNGGSGRGLSSRSMVSLPRDAEFGIDPSTVPLPPLHLRSLASSPTRRRSPSVGVLEESFSQQSQQQDYNRTPEIASKSNGGYSMRPQTPLSAAPSQPLPPPPPRAPSSASNHRPGSNNKETFSLSRKMGLQMGSEFGAVDKTALSGTALDGNYFVANHHRTMQKLQLSRKPQPLQQEQQFIDQQQFQQQQQQQYQQQQSELFKGVGVSRHIVAPDELAMAIEMEAEEMRRRQAELQETQKSRPTSMVKGSGAYHSMPIQLHLATVSESSALSDGADEAESGLQESQSPPRQDGGKIISAQEQMAYAPLELPTTIESDRSPISGFTAGISPLSPNPGSQLPPAASLGIPLSELSNASPGGGGRGGSTKSSNHGSPRSNSLSAGSGVSSSGFPSSSGLPAPLSSLSRRQMSSSPGLGSRHPMSPMNASFMEEEDRSDFHMRSLPPPKRHTNDHLFKGDSSSTQRNELPRRSSAAAAVTLSPTENGPRPGPISNDQHGGPTPLSSSGAPGTSLRPAYMARRQSSSPVLIRVSDQGGQNISPLLTGGATRTFAGDAPSREVIRRPSELTTSVSSVEGSPAPSTSTGSSSMCSFVTSRYTAQDAPPISPSQDGASTSSLPSPTSVPGRVYRTASSPLASVTPTDGCTPTTSPAPNSVLQMPGEPINPTHPALTSMTPSPAPYRGPAVVNEDIPSVVINSPRTSSSLNVVGQEPAKRVLHNVSSFRFPAPSQDATEVDSNSRPLSSCSSASLYSSASENFGAHEEEDHHTSMDEGYRSRQQLYQQQQHQQQRRGSNGLYHDGTHSPGAGMSPSLHAAALGLYPGLRKLSLFTAAVGDHPPPPLLSGRKDSAGSSVSTRDYHHGVTSPTLSIMEDGDEVTTEEEDLDLHNDEDWAGNMKSMRRGYHRDPSIVVANAAVTGEAPVRVVVDSLPMVGLAAPPLIPLPLTPPHSTAQPPRPLSSAMKAPPVIPGSYYFPTSPSVPLPPTPPVSDSIPPVSPSKNPLALAVATQGGGLPPMIPPRSPHRSVPGSPTALRSMRSYQNLVSPPPPPSGA